MVMSSAPAVATDSHILGTQLAVDVRASYSSAALLTGEGSVLAGKIRTLPQGVLLIEDEVYLFTRLQSPDFRTHLSLTDQLMTLPIHRPDEPLPVELK